MAFPGEREREALSWIFKREEAPSPLRLGEFYLAIVPRLMKLTLDGSFVWMFALHTNISMGPLDVGWVVLALCVSLGEGEALRISLGWAHTQVYVSLFLSF